MISRLIILIMKQPVQLSDNQRSFQTIDHSPQKEEWAIINRYKALEFERMKAREKMIDREKKQLFPRQLDNQLNTRTNAELREKQQDRNYYQTLSQKAEEIKNKEEYQRYQKFLNRRRIEEENMQKIEETKSSRVTDYDTGYHLQIGVQSQQERKAKSQQFKKEMLDTLDQQLRQKNEEMRKNKIQTLKIEELHNQMQDNYFKSSQKKLYYQNQKIHDYYQELERRKNQRQKELDQLLVEQARERNLKAQDEKARLEEQRRLEQNTKMKEALDQQVKQLNKKRIQESRINPQQISYGFISSMFRPKEQNFNKEKYKRDLLIQAEQQRLRKAKQNHMSQEEYRFNMNQLSKAVIGSYAQQNYLDRSLGAIGDKKQYELGAIHIDSKDRDSQIIKRRLDLFKSKGTISVSEDKHF